MSWLADVKIDDRPGFSALGSLIAEDLGGTPARARALAEEAAVNDPKRRVVHRVDVAYAALVAGEPRRALRTLDAEASSYGRTSLARLVHALRVWAGSLDGNWYPGDVSANPPNFADPLLDWDSKKRSRPGGQETDAEAILIENLLQNGPVALLKPRAMIDEDWDAGTVASRQQAFSNGAAALVRLEEYAGRFAPGDLVAWAEVAAADLMARSGRMTEAVGVFAGARRYAAENAMPRMEVLGHILEGDRRVSRGGSPETLGFNLAPSSPSAPGPGTDLEGARSCYEEAEKAASTLEATSPRLDAALQLRWAYLAWVQGDHHARRCHLEAASSSMAEAGDSAGQQLIAVHLIIADLAEARIGEALVNIGNGWSVPATGLLARIRAWAESDGSISWCAGLGRLLRRVGERWASAGDRDQASLALGAGMHLLGVLPGPRPRELYKAIAEIDAERNLTARALVRLEKVLNEPAQDTGRSDRGNIIGSTVLRILAPQARRALKLLGRQEDVNILFSIASAQDDRSHTAAASHAARGLERARARLLTLVDGRRLSELEGLSWSQVTEAQESTANMEFSLAWARSAEDNMQKVIALAVRQWLTLIDTWIPLAKARAADRLGLAFEAEQWFDAAVQIAGRSGMPVARLIAVLTAAGRLDAARAELRAALPAWDGRDSTLAVWALACGLPEIADEAFTRTAIDPLITPDLGYASTGAEIARLMHRPRRALEIARHGITMYEERLSRLIRDIDRLAMSDDSNVAQLYVTAIQACLALDEERANEPVVSDSAQTFDRVASSRPRPSTAMLSPAFEFTERARTLTMAALVEQDAVLPEGLRRQWQSAAAEWAASTDNLLAGIDTDPPIDTSVLLRNFEDAEQRLLDVETIVHTNHPDELTRHARARLPRGLNAVQERLPEGTALIEYHTYGEHLFVWSITADSAEVRQLPTAGGRSFRRTIRDYRERCVQGSGTGPEQDLLAELLIYPAEEVLRDCDRVIVVPFGSIYAVPIHTLPLDGQGLGLTHVISYALSASMALRNPLDTTFTLERMTIVGDPAFDAPFRPTLRRLPGAAVEAGAIGRLVHPQDMFIGEDATEQAVRKALSDRQVVHLATHGWLDELSPYESSLVLAGRGKLTVAELISLRMNAELAVLSACDTGRGTVTLGGDVVGLSRALLASGVRRTLVSLWPVDDAAACVTMISFYRELLAGRPAAHALAFAQRLVHSLDETALRSCYEELSGEQQDSSLRNRRGNVAADDELLDDEEVPVPAGGRTERQWAPFIVVEA